MIDFTGGLLAGQRFQYAAPGLYFPVVRVVDGSGVSTSLTTFINVWDRPTLDALLQVCWNALRDALIRGDVNAAASVFTEASRPVCRDQFSALATVGVLAQVGNDLGPIRLVRVLDGAAEYNLRAMRNGREYSFHVIFVLDRDGLWKLSAF